MSALATRIILACRETLVAGYGQRLGGVRPIAPEAAVETTDLPAGVGVTAWSSCNCNVARLDPVPMPVLHEEAMTRAWRDGAWDIQVLCHPPLHGQQLMMVGANDYADPLLIEQLIDAAQRGKLVTWSWRPMRQGPAMRIKAHAHRDVTLDADHGRSGALPATVRTLDWSRAGGKEKVVKLGMSAAQASRSERVLAPRLRAPRRGPKARATNVQRCYIIDLRRRVGRAGEPLPAALTRGEASAIIDTLLLELKR